MMKEITVWDEAYDTLVCSQLKSEACKYHKIHQLPNTLEDWKIQRSKLRNKIWSKVGIKPDHSFELDFKILKTIQMDGYKIQNIVYQSRPNFYVTGNLYIPEGKGPFPGVINMHGHCSQGRLAEKVQARGHTLAKNGYVCLSVDAFGSGERSTTHGEYEYHGGNLGTALIEVGETLMGMQIVDNMRGVDLLCSLEYVNSSKIGATGASGGGNQTMWLAAMDERITAAVPVVSIGTFESYVCSKNCICETLPDGLSFTEESAILALVAPRALKICNALKEKGSFSPLEMLRSYEAARKIFSLYQADNHLNYQIFNLTHGYWPPMREAMLGWLDKWLKNKGEGLPKTERSFRILPEKELMCFERGMRPATVQSIAAFCRNRGKELKSEALKQNSINADKKREQLQRILRINEPLIIKQIYEHNIITDDTRKWHRITIETVNGTLFPILLSEPTTKAGIYTIVVHPQSKGLLFTTKALKSLSQNGEGILLFDLWGTGETCWKDEDDRWGIHYHLARACLWLKRTLIGEWVKNLMLMKNFLSDYRKAKIISLVGYGEAGLATLFCSSLTKGIENLYLHSVPMTYQFGKNPTSLSVGIHIPGFLKWGDASLAIALTKNDIIVIDPIHLDGTCYNKSEIRNLKKEVNIFKKKYGITSGSLKIGSNKNR